MGPDLCTSTLALLSALQVSQTFLHVRIKTVTKGASSLGVRQQHYLNSLKMTDCCWEDPGLWRKP